jgi:HAE1 family hydrophobic/amphiphilic exporter-1
VDYANQLRAEGLAPRDAIVRAGPVRLRPVLMTQFATIAGMLPVALASSDGAEFRNPMGVLVIGGLLSSTLLTLIVVPAFYTLAEDGVAWLARALASSRQEGPAQGIGSPASRREAAEERP